MTFVAQPEILIIWVIYTLLGGIALMLTGSDYLLILVIALGLLLGVPFVQYGFVIIETTARGIDNMPRMAAGIFLMDGRTYRQLVIGGAFAFLINLTPPEYRLYVVSLVLLVSPAITSFIAFHSTILACVDPRRIYYFMRNMGITYIAMRMLGNSVLMVVLYLMQRGDRFISWPGSEFLISACAVFLMLVMFRGTGVLLHLRHELLGIKTEFSKAQAQSVLDDHLSKERRRLLVEAQRLLRGGKTDEAWRLVKHELQRHHYETEVGLFDMLREFDDKRLLHRLAAG